MKKLCLSVMGLLLAAGLAFAAESAAPRVDSSAAAVMAPESPYKVETVDKVGGEGRWDLLDVDPATGLLYVPRSSHCQVIEAASGKVIGDIPDTPGIHGVVAVPSAGRGFTSNGEDGSVTIFDLKTYATLGKIAADKDADVMLYDPASKRVFCLCGDPSSMYAIAADVDPVKGKADGVVDLKGKPEAGAVDGKGHLYVNMVDKNEIAVVDTKTLKITDRWPTAPGTSPVGMGIDPARGRLFVSCRNEMMIAIDTTTGKVIGNWPIGRGTDGAGFDDGYALASCGDGTMSVVREDAGDAFTLMEPVKTATGARTMVADAQHHRVYLPTADFGATPAPTTERPRPRPAMVPGTFKIVVVGR